MKLRNKKTGEIKDAWEVLDMKQDDGVLYKYYSLSELNEEWEDYEEPKDFYFIQADCDIHLVQCKTPEYQLKKFKSIGNYFDTKEEAEKAVEKLKAWKRLKDIGFHFLGWNSTYKGDNVDFYLDWINSDSKEQLTKDLDLLFGG